MFNPLTEIEAVLASFTSTAVVKDLESLVEIAAGKWLVGELLKIEQMAKDGTLPDALQPFAPILVYLVDAWHQLQASKIVPPAPTK